MAGGAKKTNIKNLGEMLRADLVKQENTMRKLEKSYGPEHFKVAEALAKLAAGYGDLGEPLKQKSFAERALTILRKSHDENHPNLVNPLISLAVAYGNLGKDSKKKKLLEQALDIQEKSYGPTDPEVARILVNLANAYSRDHPIEKKELLERALSIQEKNVGPEGRDLGGILVNLANAYQDLGDLPNRKRLLERALSILEKHCDPGHHEVGVALFNLANANGDLGDLVIRRSLLERSLAILEKHYGEGHKQVAMVLTNLSTTCRQLGDFTTAIQLLERLLEMNKQYCGPDDLQTFIIQSRLDVARMELKNSADLEIMCKKYQLKTETSPPSAETALRRAVGFGEAGDVKFVLSYADINAQDDTPTKRKTALHWALEKEREDIAKMLLDAGARIDIPDAEGKTAIDYAKASPSMRVLMEGVIGERRVGAVATTMRDVLGLGAQVPTQEACRP